jgi:hypothetical protein
MTVENTTAEPATVAASSARPSKLSALLRFSPTFFSLCVAFVMVRLPFMFTVPMQEAPDEFAHYWVLRYMRDNLHLPSAADVAAGGPSAVYGSLPQLGYLPHVLVGLVTPANEIALYARFGSLLAGLVLLYAAFNIGKIIFKDNRLLAFALPAVIVFHPQLAFLHSYSNSDATATALGAVILLLALKQLKSGPRLLPCTAIGGLMGWLALSKYSGLAVMPVVGAMLVASALLNGTPIAYAIACLTACGAAAAAASGWWFVRTYHEFNGDFMGTKTMYRTWATTFNREQNFDLPASHIIKNFGWWRMLFFSFWGLFGYMTKYMWRPVYIAYFAYLLVAAYGGIKAVVAWLPTKLRSMTRSDWESAIIWTGMFAAVVLNLIAIIWASMKNLGGAQGRYLFPSEIPVIALLLLGMSRFSERRARVLVLSFIAFNCVVCVGVWFWLFNMYGFHSRPL